MERGFIFKFFRVLAVLILTIGLAWQLWLRRPEAERLNPVKSGPLVETLTAASENLNMVIESYGTVTPRETLKLVAEVKGEIMDTDRSFQEGNFVQKGTRIIQIDPRPHQLEAERRKIQITQTEAELRQLRQEVDNIHAMLGIIKADADLTKKEVTRMEKLSQSKVTAESSLDEAKQRYLAKLERIQVLENQLALTGPQKDQLTAQLKMAEVMLDQAGLDLEKTNINVPFDGWVLEKRVENGQQVLPGEFLGSVYKDGGLDTEARIPAKDLKWFLPEMEHSQPEAEVVFSDNDSFLTWPAKAARVKAQLDERTRTLPVIVEIDPEPKTEPQKPSFFFRPGMFVLVRIKGKELQAVYQIPRHLVHENDTVYLFENNRLRMRPVSILRYYKSSVIIGKGLSDGELIIKTPLTAVSDGMQIRLSNDASPP